MTIVVEFSKAELLIRLMKEAEKYFAVGGQDRKDWVLMKINKHFKDDETKKFISDLVDIIILLDKNKLKISEIVTEKCCSIL